MAFKQIQGSLLWATILLLQISVNNIAADPIVVCPPTHDVNATLLPHPTDCSKFFYCVWGTPVEMDCPGGLHFNPTLKVCDWPWDAGCEDGDSTSAPAPSTPDAPAVTTNAPITTNAPVTTEKPAPPVPTSPPDGPLVECPPYHEDNATLLPHPTDCTKFYYCVWGTPVEMDCPAGLHFNPTLKVCDWPWDAGCEDGDFTSAPVPSTPEAPAVTTDAPVATNAPVTTEKPAPPVPTSPPSDGPLVECPPYHEDNATLLPHPTDCTKFYYCVWGTPVEMDCPAGLHFNPTLKVCDWPWDAGCEDGDSTSAPAPSTPEAQPPVTTSAPETTAAPKPTPPNGGGPAGDCPLLNDDFPVYLPNTEDCTKFFKCDWGVAHPFDCPADLHFNTKLNVCDYPYRAGCAV